MLPVIAKEKLADYIDVFCEKGFFSRKKLKRSARQEYSYGLKPKLHVNQLNSIGGIETGIKLNALSVDHLETMTDEDINKLAKSQILSELFYQLLHFFYVCLFSRQEQLIDSGCAIALASDYNPGSSPSGNMNFVLSLSPHANLIATLVPGPETDCVHWIRTR